MESYGLNDMKCQKLIFLTKSSKLVYPSGFYIVIKDLMISTVKFIYWKDLNNEVTYFKIYNETDLIKVVIVIKKNKENFVSMVQINPSEDNYSVQHYRMLLPDILPGSFIKFVEL